MPEDSERSQEMDRRRLAIALAGLTLVFTLVLCTTPRWQFAGGQAVSDTELNQLGSAVRAWYRTEAWNAVSRGEFRVAGDWALRSMSVNFLRVTAREDESTIAEIGCLSDGQSTVHLTIGLSRTSGRWTVDGAVW